MCKVLSFRITGKKYNSSPKEKALAQEVCVEKLKATKLQRQKMFATSCHLRGTRTQDKPSWPRCWAVKDAIHSPQPHRAWMAGIESTGATSLRCNELHARRSPSVSNMPRKPREIALFLLLQHRAEPVDSPCAPEAWLERDYCDFCPFLSSLQKGPFIWANFEGRARGISSMNCIWASRPHFSKPCSLASPTQWNRYLAFEAFLVDRFSDFKQRYLFWPWQIWKVLTKQGRPFSQQKQEAIQEVEEKSCSWGRYVLLLLQSMYLRLPT